MKMMMSNYVIVDFFVDRGNDFLKF